MHRLILSLLTLLSVGCTVHQLNRRDEVTDLDWEISHAIQQQEWVSAERLFERYRYSGASGAEIKRKCALLYSLEASEARRADLMPRACSYARRALLCDPSNVLAQDVWETCQQSRPVPTSTVTRLEESDLGTPVPVSSPTPTFTPPAELETGFPSSTPTPQAAMPTLDATGSPTPTAVPTVTITPTPDELAVARKELDGFEARPHRNLPRDPGAPGSTPSVAMFSLSNSSVYSVDFVIAGSTRARRFTLTPGRTEVLQLPAGKYRIGGRAEAANEVFYGEQDLANGFEYHMKFFFGDIDQLGPQPTRKLP